MIKLKFLRTTSQIILAEADHRITFTEGEVTHHSDITDLDDGDYAIWIAAISGVLAVAAVAAILVIRRKI